MVHKCPGETGTESDNKQPRGILPVVRCVLLPVPTAATPSPSSAGPLRWLLLLVVLVLFWWW